MRLTSFWQERRLLFNYVVGELSIDILGPLYNVDRSTIARRIGRLMTQVRRAVTKRLALQYRHESSSGIGGIIEVGCNDLQLDLASLLG